MPDDSFKLYDLRVQVVCPPGERILCGAKEGDYFTLEGEILYLPPNQGFSIYSLGMRSEVRLSKSLTLSLSRRCSPITCSQATTDRSERLDVDRCGDRMP